MYASRYLGRRDASGVMLVLGDRRDRSVAEPLTNLVGRALRHDETAWYAIVDRFVGLVWNVARSYGLTSVDAAQVSQTTWLRLADQLDNVSPERLAAWLVTTTRREAIQQRSRHDPAVPFDACIHEQCLESADSAARPPPRNAREIAFASAFRQLPERSRLLLIMIMTDPPLSYDEISDALDMPIGSIGPTRAHALATLRRDIDRASMPSDK